MARRQQDDFCVRLTLPVFVQRRAGRNGATRIRPMHRPRVVPERRLCEPFRSWPVPPRHSDVNRRAGNHCWQSRSGKLENVCSLFDGWRDGQLRRHILRLWNRFGEGCPETLNPDGNPSNGTGQTASRNNARRGSAKAATGLGAQRQGICRARGHCVFDCSRMVPPPWFSGHTRRHFLGRFR